MTHPPVGADGLVAEGEGLVSEGAVVGPGAAGVVVEVAVLPGPARAGGAAPGRGHACVQG